MKVSEFIEWLKTQPQDAAVYIQIRDSGRYCDDFWESWYSEEFDEHTCGHFELDKKKTKLTLGG